MRSYKVLKDPKDMNKLSRWWYWHSTDVFVWSVTGFLIADVIAAICIIIIYWID